MRQNIIIALLTACLALLGIQLGMELKDSRVAEGQAAGAVTSQAGHVMATANTQNETFLFLYNAAANKLAAYQATRKGISLLGVRSLKYDFFEELRELPLSKSPTAVINMKSYIDKLKAQQEKR